MDQRFPLLVSVAAVLALCVVANGQTSPISQDSQPVPGPATYQLQNSGSGGYQARNAAQRLQLEFTPREADLQSPNASGGLRLTGYGYGQRLQAPADAQLARTGNRVEYLRGDLTEWYVNQADGLEQGFTFRTRPPGAERGEPLVIDLAVTGGFDPMLAPDGQAVLLHSEAGAALRYGGLHTWDARGREVASRLEVRQREIRLIVDDRDAQYPLVVDPTTTLTATFTACSATLTTCSVEGTIVTLKAVVTPTPTGLPATELVTFYDGPSVIAVARLTAGATTFDTRLLLAGANCLGTPGLPCVHSLTAYYQGDGTLAASLSNTLLHTIQANPATTFGPTPGSVTVGTNPEGMVMGAFNRGTDDYADLAVANLTGMPNLNILIGDHLGNFLSNAYNNTALRSPRAVATGYFDSDRFPDLAVVDFSQNVNILLGDGSGSFDPPLTPPLATGIYPEGIVAADFNNDGKTDLAVANNGDGTVSVFLGNGDGTFQAPSAFSAALGPAGPTGIAAADFNKDGYTDLAVVNEIDGTVTIYLNNPLDLGTFSTQPSAFIGRSADNGESIAVGDFNLDGNPDVAVATNSGVSVLLGNGSGGFMGAPASYTTDSYPVAVAVGDFNGDGIPDLVVANAFGNDVSILIGNGDAMGTFQPAVSFAAGFLPSSVVVGEFNGDGITDVAVADFDSNVTVLFGENVTITGSSGSPQTAQVNEPFVQPLTVTTSSAAAGINVVFTAPSAGPSGTFSGGGNVFEVQTAGTGTATAPLFTANSISGGPYSVTAQVGWAPPSASFLLTNLPGSGEIITVYLGSPQTANVGTTFTNPLEVKVTDTLGNPLPGRTITFTAPSTGASGTFANGTNTTQAVSGTNGIAITSLFTANSIGGTYQVTATDTDYSTVFTLTNTGATPPPLPPAQIVATSGTPQSATAGMAFASLLLATVTDSSGHLVSNATVTFAVQLSPSGAGGTFIGPSVVTTGSSGTASVSILANSTPGTFGVTATVTGVAAPAMFTLTITPPLTSSTGIILPVLSLPVGGSAAFPVTLSSPATSIVYVTLTPPSNSPVSFNFTTIQFAAGSTTPVRTPVATGVSAGTATITASAFGYSSAVTTVQVGP